MGFLDVAGELLGWSDSKSWSLESEDFEDLKFTGQFVAENLTEALGANLGETTTVNKATPNFQWLNGEAEVVTFRARLFAGNSFKNIKQDIELLKSFTKRDPDLKRAQIFLFSAGTEIGFTCFVRGIRTVYDELRSDGALRGAVIDVTLQKIEDTVTENAATSLASQIKLGIGIVAAGIGIAKSAKAAKIIPGASPHTVDRTYQAKQGDTFEAIAAREYGSALVGDVLRRAQPDKEPLAVGTQVLLIEKSEILRIRVTPQATPLKNTPKNLTLRQTFLDKKNKAVTIFV